MCLTTGRILVGSAWASGMPVVRVRVEGPVAAGSKVKNTSFSGRQTLGISKETKGSACQAHLPVTLHSLHVPILKPLFTIHYLYSSTTPIDQCRVHLSLVPHCLTHLRESTRIRQFTVLVSLESIRDT